MLTALLRTIILYLVVTIGLRLSGKRQIGELQPTELVVMILISELAAVPMQNFGIPLLYGVVPILTLLCIELILSALSARFVRFRTVFAGKTSILIMNGEPNQRELSRLRLGASELLEELRLKGVFDLSTVACAYLETNGQLSVLLKPDARPASIGDLPMDVPPAASVYTTLIAQGRLLEENLRAVGRDRRWLDNLLHEKGLKSPHEVFLLVINDLGTTTLYPARAQDTNAPKKEG